MLRVLVLVLVAGVLAGAEADGCSPGTLAARVARSCAAGVATPACCEPLVASGGGSGDCVCRVSREVAVLHAGFNASHVLALYAACGGAMESSSCQAVASVAAADTSAASPAVQLAPQTAPTAAPTGSPSPSVSQPLCNDRRLAQQIQNECRETSHTARCCDAVVAAVVLPACLCSVADRLKDFTAYDIVTIYGQCHGMLPVGDGFAASCYGKSEPPPSAPPPVVFYHHLVGKDHKAMRLGAIVTIVLAMLFVAEIYREVKKFRNGGAGVGAAPEKPPQADGGRNTVDPILSVENGGAGGVAELEQPQQADGGRNPVHPALGVAGDVVDPTVGAADGGHDQVDAAPVEEDGGRDPVDPAVAADAGARWWNLLPWRQMNRMMAAVGRDEDTLEDVLDECYFC